MNDIVTSKGFKERIQESARNSIVGALTDEELDAMITQEIKAFFETPVEHWVSTQQGYYSSGNTSLKVNVSPFRAIVWAELKSRLNSRLDKFFNSEDFKSVEFWDENNNYRHNLSEMMDAKLEKITLKLAKNLFIDMFGAAIQQTRAEVQSEIAQAMLNPRGY